MSSSPSPSTLPHSPPAAAPPSLFTAPPPSLPPWSGPSAHPQTVPLHHQPLPLPAAPLPPPTAPLLLPLPSSPPTVGPTPTPPKTWPCPACAKPFSQKSAVTAHVHEVHDSRRDHACTQCAARFARRRALALHVDAVHRAVRAHVCLGAAPGSAAAATPQGAPCGFSFKHRGDMQRHVRVKHEGRRDFACPTCGKSYTTKNNMSLHVIAKHGTEDQKAWVCRGDGCARRFCTRAMRDSHWKKGDLLCIMGGCTMGFGPRCDQAPHLLRVHGKVVQGPQVGKPKPNKTPTGVKTGRVETGRVKKVAEKAVGVVHARTARRKKMTRSLTAAALTASKESAFAVAPVKTLPPAPAAALSSSNDEAPCVNPRRAFVSAIPAPAPAPAPASAAASSPSPAPRPYAPHAPLAQPRSPAPVAPAPVARSTAPALTCLGPVAAAVFAAAAKSAREDVADESDAVAAKHAAAIVLKKTAGAAIETSGASPDPKETAVSSSTPARTPASFVSDGASAGGPATVQPHGTSAGPLSSQSSPIAPADWTPALSLFASGAFSASAPECTTAELFNSSPEPTVAIPPFSSLAGGPSAAQAVAPTTILGAPTSSLGAPTTLSSSPPGAASSIASPASAPNANHGKKRNFPCTVEDCLLYFENNKDRRKHFNEVHIRNRAFNCPAEGCSAAFSRKGERENHYNSVHLNLRPWSCDRADCTLAFKHKGDRDRHVRVVHEKRFFKCDACPAEFAKKTDLNSHAMQIHGKADQTRKRWTPSSAPLLAPPEPAPRSAKKPRGLPSWTCDVPGCGRQYTRKYYLNSHAQAVHEVRRKFVCEVAGCGESFARSRSLASHVLSDHSNDVEPGDA